MGLLSLCIACLCGFSNQECVCYQRRGRILWCPEQTNNLSDSLWTL